MGEAENKGKCTGRKRDGKGEKEGSRWVLGHIVNDIVKIFKILDIIQSDQILMKILIGKAENKVRCTGRKEDEKGEREGSTWVLGHIVHYIMNKSINLQKLSIIL